jgi:hypothetical protein
MPAEPKPLTGKIISARMVPWDDAFGVATELDSRRHVAFEVGSKREAQELATELIGQYASVLAPWLKGRLA